MPGHAGETFAHFLDADRIAGIRQQSRFHFRRDDFRIDQNAVAVEDDEIETVHDKSSFNGAMARKGRDAAGVGNRGGRRGEAPREAAV